MTSTFIQAIDHLIDYSEGMRRKMSTVTVTQPQPHHNRFISFMEHIGHAIKVGLPPALKIAEGAGEVAVSIFAPGASALFNQTVAACATAEQSAVVMGQTKGTGPQKLAAVMGLMGPLIKQALADVGKSNDDAEAQKYISAVVTIINAMPAPASNGSTVATVVPAVPAAIVQQPQPPAPVVNDSPVSSGASGAASILA